MSVYEEVKTVALRRCLNIVLYVDDGRALLINKRESVNKSREKLNEGFAFKNNACFWCASITLTLKSTWQPENSAESCRGRLFCVTFFTRRSLQRPLMLGS